MSPSIADTLSDADFVELLTFYRTPVPIGECQASPACSCQGLLFLSHTAGLKPLSCGGRPCAPSYSTLAHQASRGCRAAAVTRPYLAVLLISLLFCFSSFSSLFYFLIIFVLHKLIKNCDHTRKQICTLQSLMNLPL